MRLHNALAQVIVIGFGTVLLPHFASLWARGERDEIVLLLRRLARVGMLVCAYLVGGIYLMGTPTVSVLLQRGAFDAANAERVAQLWTVLSLSLFPFAFGTFIAKLCQAMRKSMIILMSAIVSFVVVWAVSLFGVYAQSLPFTASATTLAFCATAAFWVFWLTKTLDANTVVGDIVGAVLRASVILAPPIFLDVLLLKPTFADVTPVAAILLRGATYTFIAACVMSLSGFHSWFFRRIESQPEKRSSIIS
jgi:peptidoglycan biosynthesis protein MviN/MurJ (putative lipid II flippase)